MNIQYLDDAIDLLRQMVRTPSLSFEEEGVRQVISSTLKDWGIDHIVERNNIIAVCGEFHHGRPTLVLDAHIDTIAACEGYTRDPFNPGDDPAIVWGLGSNDDGGSVVAMAAAFRHLQGRQLPVNLILALCCEEERSGENGACYLYRKGGFFDTDPRFDLPDLAIVGEPTGLCAATSERGLLVIDGLAHGQTAHAARAEEGRNALYIALDDIAALRAHRFEKISPLMGEVKLNVTQINAGSAHNVIPATCSFVVDIRPTEQYDNQEILSQLQALCSSTLSARNLRNRSSASREGSLLVEAVRSLGVETFSSPTTSDWMRMDCDAVKLGPGLSQRSHKADEFITRDEIAGAINIYISIVEKLGELYGNSLE